jgi:hypothetical protein
MPPCPMIRRKLVSQTVVALLPTKIMNLNTAEKYGLRPQQVRDLIARVGNDREKLEEEAKKL